MSNNKYPLCHVKIIPGEELDKDHTDIYDQDREDSELTKEANPLPIARRRDILLRTNIVHIERSLKDPISILQS